MRLLWELAGGDLSPRQVPPSIRPGAGAGVTGERGGERGRAGRMRDQVETCKALRHTALLFTRFWG